MTHNESEDPRCPEQDAPPIEERQQDPLISQLTRERDQADALAVALRRLYPIGRACKHEDFSDTAGNEDTRTDALKHARDTIKAYERVRGAATPVRHEATEPS
jgi:hypothetical protein